MSKRTATFSCWGPEVITSHTLVKTAWEIGEWTPRICSPEITLQTRTVSCPKGHSCSEERPPDTFSCQTKTLVMPLVITQPQGQPKLHESPKKSLCENTFSNTAPPELQRCRLNYFYSFLDSETASISYSSNCKNCSDNPPIAELLNRFHNNKHSEDHLQNSSFYEYLIEPASAGGPKQTLLNVPTSCVGDPQINEEIKSGHNFSVEKIDPTGKHLDLGKRYFGYPPEQCSNRKI